MRGVRLRGEQRVALGPNRANCRTAQSWTYGRRIRGHRPVHELAAAPVGSVRPMELAASWDREQSSIGADQALTCFARLAPAGHKSVEKADRGDPDRARAVSGDDIAGIMNPQINARKSNHSNQKRGGDPETEFNNRPARMRSENRSKHSIKTE